MNHHYQIESRQKIVNDVINNSTSKQMFSFGKSKRFLRRYSQDFKTEKYYDAEFAVEDHERLNSCLKSIKGRFILSYNDDEYIRSLYKDFDIIPVERQNNLGKGKFKELIIKNY